jgi:hypothetical protein
MTLKAAFAGIKEARGSERSGTQAPKSPGTHAAKNVGPKLLSTQAPKRAPLPLQGTAKSNHPEYTAVKIFLRRKTHKAAGRKWQDELAPGERGVDFSDLVERLLQQYLST